MSGFYRRVFDHLPRFLRRRINPLEAGIEDFVMEAARETGAGSRVLDAGAGESRFAHFFQGRSYIAIDAGVGDSAWDYTRLHVVGDLQRLPFRQGSFEVVVNTQVLEHVEEPARVLREISRVLRDGGMLYMTAPQGWHEHQQPHDFFRFTSFALTGLLRDAGLDVLEVSPIGGYFHYLGHRLTYIPKVLFSSRRGPLRVLLFPFELLSLVIFCGLTPLLCYYLDALDRTREFTLGYRCQAVKRPIPG